MDRPDLAAVVLAGGRGSRLGGVDKAAVEVQGRTFLASALAACAGCAEVVVVGDPPTTPTSTPTLTLARAEVRFVREEPRLAGPGCALLTGVAALGGTAPYVAVLAVDMPHLTAGTLDRLLGASGPGDGAVLVGADGRAQLALVLRRTALAAVTPDPATWPGLAVRRITEQLRLAQVPALGAEAEDVDTTADLERLRSSSS
ncbi:MAG TPA: NTP transferase domain-containing protein [Nocardioides sp.]